MQEIVLPLHLLTLAFILWTIVRADHYAFAWIRGKVTTLNKEKLHEYHRNTWIGLSGMIVTGFVLFWPLREFLLTRQQFYVKMAFVLTLIINGFVIGKLQHIATEKPFASLSLKQKLPLFISGAVSTLCWLGAIAGGFYLIPSF